MSGEEISDDALMSIFEAAKWAPSSFNSQPWIFIYAKRETEDWSRLFELLAEPNKVWCKNASALVVIISNNNFEHNNKPNGTHSFSAGSAFQNLALEASERDIVVHGMAGFDYKAAKLDLGVPDDYTVEAMAAIGKLGKKEYLPEELQKMEAPSGRKKLKEIVMEGKFRSQ
jgi:nitroreductase